MENCEMSTEMMDEEAEMAPGNSMSYGALVQQSSAVLKNECAILESRIENKTREVEEIKKLCERQAENIGKQQSEFEHYKFKTHSEEMQNKSHMSKIRDLREKLQVLDKYFEKWGQTINPMLGYKNYFEEKIKQLKKRQEMEEAISECLEKENKYYIEEANKSFLKLQETKNQEKNELCEFKAHLANQLEQQKIQEKELEQELREPESSCREEVIKIDILAPQRAEFQKNLEELKTELALEKEQMNITIRQLETSMQEQLNRNKQISTKIETVDQSINEITKAVRDKETEVTMLDSKQKQLNTEEEEYAKTSKNEQQELQELEPSVEELTSQFSARMKIETENIAIKAKCDDLQNESDDYERKIAEVESSEEAYKKQIEELNKSIEEMTLEVERTINEQSVIEEACKKLEKEQEDDENEHKDLSLKIDKTSAELQYENSQLKIHLQDLSEQLLGASENGDEFEKTLNNLETELVRAKAISQDSDFKLSSFQEESISVNKVYNEKIQILNERKQRSIEDYDKAISDSKLNEEVKKEVHQLETDLVNKRENCAQIFQELQDSFTMEIENKRKLNAESRARCEREYRIKEVMKTDALEELQEIKARIVDLQKQKVLVEKEIVTKTDIVRKCKNLIQRMMSKFNKVAEVAKTSNDSVADPASQQASLFTTPKTQRKLVTVYSPGSDSSGKTFNPDDVDFKKIAQKRPPLRSLTTFTNPKNMPKKKTAPAPSKKQIAQELADDWGFLV